MTLDEAIAKVKETGSALSTADVVKASADEEVHASEVRLGTAKIQQETAVQSVIPKALAYNDALDALSAAAQAAKRLPVQPVQPAS